MLMKASVPNTYAAGIASLRMGQPRAQRTPAVTEAWTDTTVLRILKGGTHSAQQLADALGTSRLAVQRALYRLMTQELIRREASTVKGARFVYGLSY